MTNTGDESLSVDSIVASGGEFTVSGGTCNPPFSFDPGDSCTIEVTFAPTVPNGQSGTLIVDGEIGDRRTDLIGNADVVAPTPPADGIVLIPTLSQWGMIALGGLLAFFAWMTIRQ